MSEALALLDAAVAKATGVSEVAQLARLETSLRAALWLAWRRRGRVALDAAEKAIPGGVPAVTAAVNAEMGRWAGDVGMRIAADVRRAWKLARLAGARKATGAYKGSLTYDAVTPPTASIVRKADPEQDAALAAADNLVDEEAVDALALQQLMWIGRHYNENIGKLVSQAAEMALRTGAGRVEVGALLREMIGEALGITEAPAGFVGDAASYFTGLAANAVTAARNAGQLASFEKLGVEKYVVVNPMDERTCAACSQLNGVVFEVADGRQIIDELVKARTPDEVKAAQPWFSPKQIQGLKGAGGAKVLASAGCAVPPFHSRCRCVCDIVDEP